MPIVPRLHHPSPPLSPHHNTNVMRPNDNSPNMRPHSRTAKVSPMLRKVIGCIGHTKKLPHVVTAPSVRPWPHRMQHVDQARGQHCSGTRHRVAMLAVMLIMMMWIRLSESRKAKNSQSNDAAPHDVLPDFYGHELFR